MRIMQFVSESGRVLELGSKLSTLSSAPNELASKMRFQGAGASFLSRFSLETRFDNRKESEMKAQCRRLRIVLMVAVSAILVFPSN